MGGLFYQITARGIVSAEELGIAPEDLVKANNKARIEMLNGLAKVYEEQGRLYMVQNSELYGYTGLSEIQATANLLVLHHLYLAEPFGNGGSRLMNRGLDAVREYRKGKTIAVEFETISNMSAQPRGRAFQKLLARVIQRNGWTQEEGVRTSNEEMDIMISRGREFYLMESKWEKDSVEAGVIRELMGKLNNRIDVRGMVASMSGFTTGAVEQVQQYANQRVILLFGEQDISALVYGKASFEDLLNEKYKELVTRGRVSFS
jgi:hypothetical protein